MNPSAGSWSGTSGGAGSCSQHTHSTRKKSRSSGGSKTSSLKMSYTESLELSGTVKSGPSSVDNSFLNGKLSELTRTMHAARRYWVQAGGCKKIRHRDMPSFFLKKLNLICNCHILHFFCRIKFQFHRCGQRNCCQSCCTGCESYSKRQNWPCQLVLVSGEYSAG